MNLGAMIQRFRVLTRDTVKRYMWQDDEIAPWFVEAESEAAIRSRLIRDDIEIDITAGDAVLDLPADLFEIEYAELRDSSGNVFEITALTRKELSVVRPLWRTTTERPAHFIHEEKTLVLGAIADQDYILYVEFFRTPRNPLSSEKDEPEIAAHHHEHLIDWVMFRAYSKPDSDSMNPGKAQESEARFIDYFGPRPKANLRRRQNANRPHRNTLHS